MRSSHLICSLVLMVALALPVQAQEAPAELSVDFTQQRVIGGTSTFSREAYITLHHNFSNISASEITYLLDDLEADLGRTIGRVDWEFQFVKEDPNREGFPLLSDMWARGQQTKANDRNTAVMRRFADDDIIFTAHAKRIFPNEPYQQQNANANHFIPKNIDGAASYYTRLLDWYFGDGGNPRPRYLEVMNEPLVKAWEMGTTQHELIEFHGVVADSFKQAFPDALVGGYASAYPEYEKDGFGVWNNTMKDFIDTVGDKMDFLSVHLYDFYPLDPNREVVSRSGSNVEAILDLIRQYSYLTMGEVKPFVISEYGATGDGLTDNPYTPERDFHTLRSTTSKLLQLMDRPDQMLKTIPFIIGRTDNVDNPYPWAARRKLADGSHEWTHLIKFYQLWTGMTGTYVGVNSSDPDILIQALRDGNTGYIAVHNLLDTAQAVTFDLGDLSGTSVASVTERRLWMPQATPVFNEQTLTAMPAQDTMQPFETRLYRVDFAATPTFASEVRTTYHYADDYLSPIRSARRSVDFNINGVPVSSDGTYTGVLRVSVDRPHPQSPLPSRVVLNGVELPVSYTHLTLPTTRSLLLSGGAASPTKKHTLSL